MSRYWLIVQLAMAALFAVMALVMGVVLLSYLIYIDADPRMARDLPFLTQVAAWFLLGRALFHWGAGASGEFIGCGGCCGCLNLGCYWPCLA